MNRGIVSALIVAALLLAAQPARANQFRIGPLLSARGNTTAVGFALEYQLQEKLNAGLKISYMNAGGDDVTSIQPQLVFRTPLADKWEFFAGAGLAIMPTNTSGSDSAQGTPVGGGVDLGASYRLSSNNMLVSPFLEFAYGEGDDIRVSYLGLGVRLDFDIAQ